MYIHIKNVIQVSVYIIFHIDVWILNFTPNFWRPMLTRSFSSNSVCLAVFMERRIIEFAVQIDFTPFMANYGAVDIILTKTISDPIILQSRYTTENHNSRF
jgi:hypothetical protein